MCVRRFGLRPSTGRWRLLAVVVGAVLFVLAPSAVSAHEFGPFAIDRYAALRVAPDEVELDYVLSLAETPTQADGDSIEADPDAYCTELADQITFDVDGQTVELAGPTTTTLRQDGDGGLTTLRVSCRWVMPVASSTQTRTMEFSDENYSGRAGWREIIVIGDQTSIDGDVTDESLTDRLTDYPDPSRTPTPLPSLSSSRRPTPSARRHCPPPSRVMTTPAATRSPI